MTITIYHNPDCGTSRNTLAMIRRSSDACCVKDAVAKAEGTSDCGCGNAKAPADRAGVHAFA